MINTEQLINERVQILDSNYREFVLSDFIETATLTLGEGAGLQPTQLAVLENGFRLWLLCFFNKTELIEFVTTEGAISPAIAEELVLAFNLSLPEIVKNNLDNTYAALNSEENFDLESEIVKTEQEFNSLSNIRTMAQDMDHLPDKDTVHHSSQSDLIFRNESNNGTNRWGTDTN